ncbi:electron transport complex subunit RsxC [Rhodocyclus purpureus]|uniref:electron transport complex subunit RsxC n=1 Tax=Rhodocyclus purpureus TaxID=1067 RepID=UPI001911F516|nr:electron transport complex subunit RsxC [Rhodocyclus purpureus]MBK5915659.1 electron transport complex subunit RsxC [Rhodocyclus purpureus]
MIQLFKFRGGIKPASNKDVSSSAAIAKAPLPARLYLPLRVSARTLAQPLVAVGEHVLKGQAIASAEGVLGTTLHAPTSGVVSAIDAGDYPHPSALPVPRIVIDSDGDDRWCARKPLDAASASPDELRRHLREAGIVGLGGAGFPSHVKLSPGQAAIATLIINGAECEPWITCDDRLMQERAAEIIAGALILHRAIGARRVLIGIEDNKPQAIAAMQKAARQAAGGTDLSVVAVPTLYPAGGEKQLIRVLTGIEIPFGKLGFDFGVQCFNVGTAYAVQRAVVHGEPLISRIVTLTGNVEQAGNWEVLLGTPIAEFVALGRPRPDTDRYLMGGPMMGIDLASLAAPLVKTSNCTLVGSPRLFPPRPPEMPCIRCGSCARACPHELQPFELYWFARAGNLDKAKEYHLFDCIECGCCSYVCPSHIPLVQYFRFAKGEISAREREKKAAAAAKERFEFRNERAEREKAEKAERLARAAAAKAAESAAPRGEAAAGAAAPAVPPAASAAAESVPATAAAATPSAADAARKAAIAAAMERARVQREAVQARNTEALSPEQQREIAAIEARRASAAGAAAAAPPAETPTSAPELP